ncbi:ureidoglycolate lyase [Hyphomicrobium sp. CS1GBMeth3]|uniref:ureidoglycolate lyase n=1 Tax=Hyphomicrobium sp. CS1GBMeth3 TaxID=1892845 RepID=UPI000931CE92|nr:ureidoglycolate lyase [Hyphomicrobium sp. CS1GBMeth3]
MPLAIEPLSKSAFEPFGEVIEIEGAETRLINEGFATRFHALARVNVSRGRGRPIVSLFRAIQRPMPIKITMLERHPLGSQAFFPLNPSEWLIVVAEGGDAPDLATLRCFRARGDQGVNYARGIWHYPVLILAPWQDFLVVDRDGKGNNLEEHTFAAGSEVELDIGPDDIQ